MSAVERCLVFFGAETSSYEDDCDILQIFMKCGSSTFNEYINPTQMISKQMTKVHHLTARNGCLYRDKDLKRSRPWVVVSGRLLKWLKGFNKSCTLVGHHYNQYRRLMSLIQQGSLVNEFGSVIAGFTSTYNLFRTKFPDYDSKDCSVHRLALKQGIKWPCQEGRSIKIDVILLEKLAALHFTDEQLMGKKKISVTGGSSAEA